MQKLPRKNYKTNKIVVKHIDQIWSIRLTRYVRLFDLKIIMDSDIYL